MSMTHYMELLATSQPWNLIIYIAIPVILAETLVATEFFVVYAHQFLGRQRTFNQWVGIILGFYFLVAAHVAMVFGMLDPSLGINTAQPSHMNM